MHPLTDCICPIVLQTLEFCRTVQPDLSNYEADGVRTPVISPHGTPHSHDTSLFQAWPTMLDDFVSWKKASGPAAHTEDQVIEVV